MNNLPKALMLLTCLTVAGCSRGWDKQKLEAEVLAGCNNNLAAKSLPGKCTDIRLVPDGENKFTGFVDFSDGSQKSVTVTIDPASGDWVTS